MSLHCAPTARPVFRIYPEDLDASVGEIFHALLVEARGTVPNKATGPKTARDGRHCQQRQLQLSWEAKP